VEAPALWCWEQQAGEYDLGADGRFAAGVEEQRELPILFRGADYRYFGALTDDLRSDGDLSECAALAHAGVGWAGFRAKVFEPGLRAGGQTEAARGDAEVARVAYVECGQWRRDAVMGRRDLDGEFDRRGSAESLGYKRDVEPGRLSGMCGGCQARAD